MLLRRVLKSLSHQTLPPEQFEIIVVDDSSTDNTADVCAVMKRDLPNLKYRSTGRNKGIGNAANEGVRSAKGDYLLFIDDDCVAWEDWAEHMRDALIKHPLVAGGVNSSTSHFIKLCHNIAQFHRFMPGRKEGPVDFIAGANMGFRRSLFEDVKGFTSSRTTCPDMDFILKARQKGYQIYFSPDAVVIHEHVRTTLAMIFSYSADHASESIILRNRHRVLMRTPFILRSPVLIIAAAPIIALKVTGDIYLKNTNNIKFICTVPVVYALKIAWCWGAARGLRNWNKSGKRLESGNEL